MFIKMLHAPCKSPLLWEMFKAHYMTKFPQILPFLSFQCSTLFSARSGQINQCCMPYLPSFWNEVHIVNVKPEDSELLEENRDDGFYAWMKVSGNEKPRCVWDQSASQFQMSSSLFIICKKVLHLFSLVTSNCGFPQNLQMHPGSLMFPISSNFSKSPNNLPEDLLSK